MIVRGVRFREGGRARSPVFKHKLCLLEIYFDPSLFNVLEINMLYMIVVLDTTKF